ncbi:replication-associated recombination protein A [Pseudohaliea rubra]|uniref:Replication-associated recombination protein A n=1 Tax=Pseudohaliea rubra DSM 19751 TaxID=1265313 RepID=A0A095VPX6_9GAMM|nr:replication-associated recombination protein A [Pseudohaliea rubra]KGE03517.1 Holliday junction DNA helicase [Pseudohaliea rubra DSM 19751]
MAGLSSDDLFAGSSAGAYQPLAARLRPASLDAFVGQRHLLGPGKPLASALARGQLHSMLFWGPPGVGKTTLARLAAGAADAEFLQLSAVLAGVRDIRSAVDRALAARAGGRDTVLFVDEVHRFNKAQQDAFLPYVEDGTLIFIGATTENPAFELNSALLSRARVYKLRPLAPAELETLLERGLTALPEGLPAAPGVLARIATQADGDGRRALNLLELAADLAAAGDGAPGYLDDTLLDEVLQQSLRRFDKGGDAFYDQISALHKAVRGSAPDAAVYWLCRMLDGGCDPLYIARRVVRMASEDIGNADPRALGLALDAWQVLERLGSPEGELALAQAVLYLAVAPKSNAVYSAFKAAGAAVQAGGSEEVPNHLRNAPTALAKAEGHGSDYRYAHDEPEGYAAGENYFPEALQGLRFYHPVDRGLEQRIAERLARFRSLDAGSARRRYRG